MAIGQAQAEKVAGDYTAAWNTGDPHKVASFFAPNGAIVINAGDPWRGRERVAEMAAGFFADIPDLALTCDGVRAAGGHVLYLWTFTGTHAGSGHRVKVSGWEEWDFGPDGLIASSRGWFDGNDYARQTTGRGAVAGE
jgi:uncharacterized protein (TIGR02246 family)